MHRQVILRPNQKLTDGDLNNIQAFTKATFDNYVTDAVAKLRYFAGFEVTRTGAADITVAGGRYWAGGPVYLWDTPQQFNMLTGGNFIPVATKRIVAVCVSGQTVETDLQQRSFKINDQNVVQPDSVAMERLRKAVITLVPGNESPDPQKPSIPIDVIPVAWVLLDTGGVVIGGIETATDYKLKSTEDLAIIIAEIEAWRAVIGQTINTIVSELGRIQAALPDNLEDRLANMLARIEALEAAIRKPTTGTPTATHIDRFLTDVYTNAAAGGYKAVVDNGLRFPIGTPEYQALELNNPTDPKITKQGNLVLPAWTSQYTRVSIDDWNAQLSISQYVSHETQRKQCMVSRRCTKYSRNASDFCGGMSGTFNYYSRDRDFKDADLARTEYTRFLNQESVKGQKGHRRIQFGLKSLSEDYDRDEDDERCQNFRHHQLRCRQHVHYHKPYWTYVTKDCTHTGSQVAQTWFNASNGWLTSVDIPFSQVDTAGNVHVLIVEVEADKPKMGEAIGRGTIDVANLKTTGRVRCTLEDPVYTEGGKMYAAVLVTTGNHYVRVRTDNKYVSGTAFYLSDDAEEWLPVQNSGDLCLAFNYAQFNSTRVDVLLEPLVRGGGISYIKVIAAQWEPEGTSLTFEVQRGGAWYQLSEGEYEALSTNPTTLPLRMVFTGTRDLMPGIDMSQTEVETGLIDDDFNHSSTALTVPATTSCQVHVDVAGWDNAAHTLSCQINGEAHDTVTVTPDPDDNTRAKIVFVLTPSSTTSAVVKLIGQTTDPDKLFVVQQRILYSL